MLDEIKNSYLEKEGKLSKINDRIIQRERQIERLKQRKYKAQDDNWWGDALIQPILNHIYEKYNMVNWTSKRLIPLGMRSAVSVFGKFEDKTIAITFTPHNLSEGIIAFDCGKINDGVTTGSLSDLNGFNNIEKPLTNIQDLYNHIEKQC